MSSFDLSRRGFMVGGGTAGLVALSGAAPAVARSIARGIARPAGAPAEVARDEAFWSSVAAQYRVTGEITNLENGYWGIMAEPVLETYKQLTGWLNRENTWFARRELGAMFAGVREKVADFLGVASDEIALTRGATETLQALIGGYNRLSPGDTVLYADLDYSEMKNAMRWLAERRGVKLVKINYPEPASRDAVIDLYARAFAQHPGIKMMLMTHLNNWTGLISPVAEVARMARQRDIDVILDAAHSVGQVDFRIADLGCDFVGVNLHKWVGAPIGCGVMYIRRPRITHIDTYMGKTPGSPDITARIDTGTANWAAYMAIPAAIDFHNKIGTANKEARLRYLRDLWVGEVRGLAAIDVLTPDDPGMVAGLTSFRLRGVTSTPGNNALTARLADEFGVLTVRRTGPAAGDCVRVTPAVYNTPADVMKLAAALKTIAAQH